MPRQAVGAVPRTMRCLLLKVELLRIEGAEVRHDPGTDETALAQLLLGGHIAQPVQPGEDVGCIGHRTDEEGAFLDVDTDDLLGQGDARLASSGSHGLHHRCPIASRPDRLPAALRVGSIADPSNSCLCPCHVVQGAVKRGRAVVVHPDDPVGEDQEVGTVADTPAATDVKLGVVLHDAHLLIGHRIDLGAKADGVPALLDDLGVLLVLCCSRCRRRCNRCAASVRRRWARSRQPSPSASTAPCLIQQTQLPLPGRTRWPDRATAGRPPARRRRIELDGLGAHGASCLFAGTEVGDLLNLLTVDGMGERTAEVLVLIKLALLRINMGVVGIEEGRAPPPMSQRPSDQPNGLFGVAEEPEVAKWLIATGAATNFHLAGQSRAACPLPDPRCRSHPGCQCRATGCPPYRRPSSRGCVPGRCGCRLILYGHPWIEHRRFRIDCANPSSRQDFVGVILVANSRD